MLRGRFGDTSGRPHIEGYVLLPRLENRGNVSFIFDTGADRSLLMPLDGQRMGIDYKQFEKEDQSLGIGGISSNYIEPAYLAFVGDNELYGYEIELCICQPSEAMLDIPSLLGRDIIDQWRIIYDKSQLQLLAEVLSSDECQSLDS